MSNQRLSDFFVGIIVGWTTLTFVLVLAKWVVEK
jgi:hypothetical protein